MVGEVDDGARLLEELARSRAAVLILDVSMPGGGPDLAASARQASASLKIVVFSAHDDPATRRSMLHAGAEVFVAKSGRLGQLRDALLSVRPPEPGPGVHER